MLANLGGFSGSLALMKFFFESVQMFFFLPILAKMGGFSSYHGP